MKKSNKLLMAMALCTLIFDLFYMDLTSVKKVANQLFPLLQDSNAVAKHCSPKCIVIRQARYNKFNADLLNNTHLVTIVQQAKQKMIQQFKQDYGVNYFHQMFQDFDGTSRGRSMFVTKNTTSELHWQRLKERFMLKILKVQRAILQEEQMFVGKEGGDCGFCATNDDYINNIQNENKDKSNDNNSEDEEIKVTIPDYYDRFVYSAAGHSSAAGHGNFEHESYAFRVEESVSDLFQSIGLEFEARNYGMSATPSTPEMSFCIDSLYGLDSDLLSWDFGMTDARRSHKVGHFLFRAGLHPNRPGLLAFQQSPLQTNIIDDLVERVGLTILPMSMDKEKQIFDAIPDMTELSRTEQATLTRYLKHFKCGGQLEAGEPLCHEEKFNTTICPVRQWRAKWHPGWKRLAISGTILSLFLSELVLDAVLDLQSRESITDIDGLISEIVQRQNDDYDQFMNHDELPNKLLPINETEFYDVPMDMLYKKSSLCHIAKLPSEMRYKGILTGHGKDEFDMFYMEGLERNEYYNRTNESDDGQMTLMYDIRNRQTFCNVSLNIDFMDSFTISSSADGGWSSLTLPTESERKIYYDVVSNLLGVVMICLVNCKLHHLGGCLGDEILVGNLISGDDKLDIEVNGQAASLANFEGSECFVLQKLDDGSHIFESDSDGFYTIKARVPLMNLTEPKILQISSIIIL